MTAIAQSQLDQSRTAWDHFNLDTVRSVGWLAIEAISAQTHNFPRSGSILRHIDQLLVESFPDRKELTGAAMVCGDMEAERGIFEKMTSVRFTDVAGFDLSEASLRRARPTPFKFHPFLGDCNNLILGPDQFDMIVGAHGIHHIFNIGGLFFQINKALRPGGILFLHEWVGPEKLQIPPANAWVARFLLCALFTRKERTNHEGRVKGKFLQYGPELFEPSEACNSLEIPAQLAKYFEVKSELAYGSLCYPMFEGLGRNFRPDRRWDVLRVKFVIAVERFLTRLRLIKPLFLIAVAKKRSVWQ